MFTETTDTKVGVWFFNKAFALLPSVNGRSVKLDLNWTKDDIENRHYRSDHRCLVMESHWSSPSRPGMLFSPAVARARYCCSAPWPAPSPTTVGRISTMCTRPGYLVHTRFRVRSSEFNWASCEQLYTANDSSNPPPPPVFCLFLSNISFIYEGAIGQSHNRRHLFVTICAGTLGRATGGNIDSWNWVGTKYAIDSAMSQKCWFLKLEFTSFPGPPSPLPRINSTT